MKNDLKVKNLVKDVLAGLTPRQKKVLEGRFGLAGKQLTLAEIGNSYGLTRERVRQIEKAALAVVKLKINEAGVSKFMQTIADHFKRYNGIRGEVSLLADLGCPQTGMPHLKFLMEASGKFHYRAQDNDFNNHWHVGQEASKKAYDFISKLKGHLKNNREAGYKPKDELELNYVSVSRAFAYNAFNDFGLSEWSEVCPQNAREWAYLVLKKEKRPLHFNELAAMIDRVKKGSKKTNAQTVHNELIKDDRFVLVGRGTYGLREFGLLPGTAKEVIAHFLKKHGPLRSHEVVQFVTQERAFKENTLLLNLQNRKHFHRLDDGRYTVREA